MLGGRKAPRFALGLGQGAQEYLFAQHLPAPVFKAPFNVAQQQHLFAIHAAVFAAQHTDGTVAQHVEIMPVGPCVQRRAALFRLFGKMRSKLGLIIGDHGAVGHDKCRVKIIVINTVQRLNIKFSRAVNKMIHGGADGLLQAANTDTDTRIAQRFDAERAAGNLPDAFPSLERARLLLDLRQGHVFRARAGFEPQELSDDLGYRARMVLHCDEITRST